MERALHGSRRAPKQRSDAIFVPLEGIASLAGVPPGPLTKGGA